ncbi:MAG: DegT/DnrJ/EryC1/StrS family aminotransferase [Pseudoclavibacter sp.]|nr:DegT/DnrJ/EryC1/StrS family aminotransferase [Pseudoclavibacter sp.]
MSAPPAPVPLARPLIGREERRAVDRVLAGGRLAQGPEVASFEEEFSRTVEGRFCIAVASGTAALQLALLAAGVGPGDEVVVPAFTFAATAAAVRLSGAVPVFVDVEQTTLCIDPDAAEAAITPRTAAIVPVHLYGHPADANRLAGLARRRGLLLLEDAAQAHLAGLRGRPAGTMGELAAFSFYATKNMTTGEGGMVTTADPALARRVRLLRNQGMEQRYRHEIVGCNERMTELAAAIGRCQLRRLAEWTETRRRNAARLDEGLRDVPGLVTPVEAAGARHVYHQYAVRHPRRDELAEHLAAAGIGTAVHYPLPLHRIPAYAPDPAPSLPVSERASAEVLSLPVRPDLSETDLARIVAAVRSFGGRP